MKLIKDHSDGAYAVSVPCLACGKVLRLAEVLIDIEGPALKAYYHLACLPAGTKMPEGKCNRSWCARCTTEVV
jgi:hypothetical protein